MNDEYLVCLCDEESQTNIVLQTVLDVAMIKDRINMEEIIFPVYTGKKVTVASYTIMKSGEVLESNRLSCSRTLEKGTTASFRKGDFIIHKEWLK